MDEPDRHPRDELRRELSLNDAVFLVVASVVGSGIFLTPDDIAARLPHPGLIFAAWAVGGLLSLAGALANAELGGMFPRAGGDYVYLREAFHPLAGFLVGWVSFFAIFAGTIATLAVGFAEGIAGTLGWGRAGVLAIAVGTVALSSWVNWLGVRYGAWANNLTSYVKVAALLAFGLLAPFSGHGALSHLHPLVEGAGRAASLGAFGMALSPVLFSYLGWNATIYVGSELRDPARNLPRSLFLGLAICTGLYMLMNAVYLYALPVPELARSPDAGEAAARVLFGPRGGSLLAGFVLVSILGTLNATILVGPRIAYAMSLDGLFPGFVERVVPGRATPGRAILVQAGVSAALILVLQTFPSALDYTTFAILVATIADVAALYALRRRAPGRARPYRAWGYPWVPALYMLASAGIALVLLMGSTRESLISLGVLASGLPFYLLFTRRGRRGAGPGGGEGVAPGEFLQ